MKATEAAWATANWTNLLLDVIFSSTNFSIGWCYGVSDRTNQRSNLPVFRPEPIFPPAKTNSLNRLTKRFPATLHSSNWWWIPLKTSAPFTWQTSGGGEVSCFWAGALISVSLQKRIQAWWAGRTDTTNPAIKNFGGDCRGFGMVLSLSAFEPDGCSPSQFVGLKHRYWRLTLNHQRFNISLP